MNAVIDTNVILSGLKSKKGYSYRLLQLLPEKQFTPCISVPLILEYEAILKKHAKHLTDKYVDDFLNYICAISNSVKIHYLWRPILKDPFDDHILELAVNAQAESIITFNTDDFKECIEFGITVEKPKEFLLRIGGTK